MKNYTPLLAAGWILFTSSSVFAMSPEAEEGKALYQVCHACHNPELNPALGPPMWGVTRRYKRASTDRNDFINRIVSFVKKPDASRAVMTNAVKNMGLMPPLEMPDDQLRKIAAYLDEEKFGPPCTHWKHAIEKGTLAGDSDHVKKDMRQFQRFCQ